MGSPGLSFAGWRQGAPTPIALAIDAVMKPQSHCPKAGEVSFHSRLSRKGIVVT